MAVRQAGGERDRRPEEVLRLLALARLELRDASLDEAEADGVEAQDVALDPHPPDLAQRALGRVGIPGPVGVDEGRPQLLECRSHHRRGRDAPGRRSAGRRGAHLRRRGEQQQDAEGDRRDHAPPARVFPT